MKVQKDSCREKRTRDMNRETGTKILLIASFSATLALPTLVYPAVRSHLDQQNYENRELASFPELSAANFDNIPTEFEAYYNDHVPFKNLFVKAKTKLDLELLNESSISDVTVGKENWLFYTVSEKVSMRNICRIRSGYTEVSRVWMRRSRSLRRRDFRCMT